MESMAPSIAWWLRDDSSPMAVSARCAAAAAASTASCFACTSSFEVS